MSFHPWSVRPIGTERFNSYLLDLFTDKYYSNMLPCEEDPKKIPERGGTLWKQETDLGPWETLCTAVLSLAVKDYLNARSFRCIGKIYELEEFFHQNEISEMVYNELMRRISEHGLRKTMDYYRVYW